MAHALSDAKRVESYITAEVSSAEAFEQAYYEPCGWRGEFVRINLKAVKEGKISAAELAAAFRASAFEVTAEDIERWKTEWQSIARAVRVCSPNLADFEQDSTSIAAMLEGGDYALHHSRKYNKAYNPHYRIVSKAEYNKLKDRLK